MLPTSPADHLGPVEGVAPSLTGAAPTPASRRNATSAAAELPGDSASASPWAATPTSTASSVLASAAPPAAPATTARRHKAEP